MTVATKARTPEEAITELRALHAKHGRGRGPGKNGLTLKIIAAQVGLRTTVTLSWWLSEGDNHHAPIEGGAVMQNLCTFLDKCKNKDWLKKLIAPKGKK